MAPDWSSVTPLSAPMISTRSRRHRCASCLEERVDLVGDGNVLDVSTSEETVTVMMQDETPIGRGRIAITATQEPLAIQQWTVTDPQGFETTVALFEVEYGRPTDPNWFFIDHLNRGE
jgi:hypothetical protein